MSIPLTVFEPLIQRVSPLAKVPVPSVTMKGSIFSRVVMNPLTNPVAAPTASAAITAAAIGQCAFTLSCATVIADSVSTDAADMSKSPAVIGKRTPSVRTTTTACEPRMLAAFAPVRKVEGRIDPNSTMTRAQAITSP